MQHFLCSVNGFDKTKATTATLLAPYKMKRGQSSFRCHSEQLVTSEKHVVKSSSSLQNDNKKLSSISLYYYYYFLLMYLHCVFCWYLAHVVFLIIIWFYTWFYYDSVLVQTGQKCKKLKLIKKVYEAVCELNSKMTCCKMCDSTWKKSRNSLPHNDQLK